MDAFAVSIGKGLTVKKLRGIDACKTALWFGGFQALSLYSAILRPPPSVNTSPPWTIGSFSDCSP